MLATFASGRSHALLFALTAGVTFVVDAAPAAAAEQTLRFKLVTQQLGPPSALPEIGGHKIVVGEYMGVAVFEDGRIAYKRFVEMGDDTAEAGAFKGYSTYTFEKDGSLTLSYSGGWDGEGFTGAYEVISGTGTFAGATGTGSFKGVDEPWDEATMLEGSFTLTLATQ